MEVTACTKAGRYEVAWHIRPLGIVGSDGIERMVGMLAEATAGSVFCVWSSSCRKWRATVAITRGQEPIIYKEICLA